MGTGLHHVVREAITWSIGACAIVIGLYYVNSLDVTLEEAAAKTRGVIEHAAVVHDDSNSNGYERSVRVRADRRGHFAVKAYVDGRPVDFMADTGATVVALSYEEAGRLGLTGGLQFTAMTKTANGTARVAPVMIDRIEVDDIIVRNVRAMVAEPGKLNVNLLGMSFISKLSRFEMQGNELILVQ
jgi:aspartyl protease family protein